MQIYAEDGRAVGCFLCGASDHTLKECPHKDSELGQYILGMLVGGVGSNNQNNHNRRQFNSQNHQNNRNFQQQTHHNQSYPNPNSANGTSAVGNPNQKHELKQMVKDQAAAGDISVPAGFTSATKLS